MSEPIIEILFDKPDRTYAPGEEITGVVRVRVDEEYECWTLTLRYGWRTHGRGNRASGKPDEMALAYEEHWSPDTTYVYRLRFRAPRGPATYHGNYLNLDWYIIAEAEVSTPCERSPFELTTQPTELLLRAGDNPIRLRPRSFSSPEEHDGVGSIASPVAVAVFAAVIGVVLLLLSQYGRLDAATIWLGIAIFGIVFSVMLRFSAAPNTLAALKLGKVMVRINSGCAENSIQTTILFSPKHAIHLEQIAVDLAVVESATAGSGSRRETHTHTICRRRLVEPCFQRVDAKQDFQAELALGIPPNLPVTFSVPNNAVMWTMTVKLSLHGWFNWTSQTLITVDR
jgi:hypothetical protein